MRGIGRLAGRRSQRADLEACLADDGPTGIVIGVQGGHIIEGSLANIARLRDLGVRMFALGHVMDNALVGSSTGRGRGGLRHWVESRSPSSRHRA